MIQNVQHNWANYKFQIDETETLDELNVAVFKNEKPVKLNKLQKTSLESLLQSLFNQKNNIKADDIFIVLSKFVNSDLTNS